jgi:hypothetical protein
MSTLQQDKTLNTLVQEKIDEMTQHPAWHGDLTGMEAESLLRFQPAGTYLLRQGERTDLFYLSFVIGTELSHLPIKIDSSSHQWFYLNSTPHYAHDLTSFIPEIMHREEAECHPLAQFAMISL